MTETEAALGKKEPIYDIRNLIKEVSREAKKSKTPIFIAMLAATLALVSMSDGDADKRVLESHIESSNQFAYFQAKNIRKTDSEIAASTFESLGKAELAVIWRQKAERYGKEKAEILKVVRAEQAKRTIALRQSDYFSFAIAFLQIAIVLASASLILGGGILLGISFLFTAGAIFFTVNGYGLYYDIPTDPATIANWVKSLM